VWTRLAIRHRTRYGAELRSTRAPWQLPLRVRHANRELALGAWPPCGRQDVYAKVGLTTANVAAKAKALVEYYKTAGEKPHSLVRTIF